MRYRAIAAAGSLFAIASTGALAERPSASADAWNWEIEAGGVYRAESNLDAGGDLNLHRVFASLSTSRRLDDRTRIGFSLGYGEDRYDFSGSVGFGGLAPWDRIRQATAGASVFHKLDERWTFYGIPSVRFNAENGASWNDGQTLGLLAGASYRFNDSLTLGPGFGVFEEIEDDVSFFPILIVDWKITDRLSLETGRGFAASRGPGLQLRWRSGGKWEIAAGGRYEKNRFRLDKQGVAPEGVGEDVAIPLFIAAQYAASPKVSLSLIGGVDTAAELRLEDASGKTIARSDADSAPFIGATLRLRL